MDRASGEESSYDLALGNALMDALRDLVEERPKATPKEGTHRVVVEIRLNGMLVVKCPPQPLVLPFACGAQRLRHRPSAVGSTILQSLTTFVSNIRNLALFNPKSRFCRCHHFPFPLKPQRALLPTRRCQPLPPRSLAVISIRGLLLPCRYRPVPQLHLLHPLLLPYFSTPIVACRSQPCIPLSLPLPCRHFPPEPTSANADAIGVSS
ncbi:hypothetical protein BHE74_00034266 [Ensete ventricosum]|nr:hypothetical protein BHE74_00034266 [Ensete ventricosum]